MRGSLGLLLLAFSLFACDNTTARLDGDGCQPACVTVAVDGESSEVDTSTDCLDEDESPVACLGGGQGTVLCQTGLPSCETGVPTCADGTRPFCGR
ncbi:MAG: hypothetical protein KF901_08210 [Myxococcales bacterium]|nr:hypothetical protein [Myxococcales bacterium]